MHLRGEFKKFNITREESKEKKLQGEKTKLAHVTVISTYLPIKRIK
jgi:hypothetical protein